MLSRKRYVLLVVLGPLLIYLATVAVAPREAALQTAGFSSPLSATLRSYSAALVTLHASPTQVFPVTLLGGYILFTLLVLRRYGDRLNSWNVDLTQLIEQRTQSLIKTRDAVIFGLARLADSRDNETGEHLSRIRRYTQILAEEIASRQPGLTRDFIDTLVFASSLHDIGKVGIPDAILLKAGKLSAEERAIMQQHTLIGGECLAAIRDRLGEDDFLEIALEITMAHHERWDGNGYPLRLQGSDIPLSARIVALADYYDALTSQRVYKLAMSHDEARKNIVEESGRQFDPVVVESFWARESEFQKIAEQMGCQNNLAEVRGNNLFRRLPFRQAVAQPVHDYQGVGQGAIRCVHRMTTDFVNEVHQQTVNMEECHGELSRLIAETEIEDSSLRETVEQIIDASKFLQGQFARTSTLLERQSAQMEEFYESIGSNLPEAIAPLSFEQEWNKRAKS